MSFKRNVILMALAAIVVAVLPYLLIQSFSIKNDSWAYFGTYLSGITSLINVVIFIFVTYLIHQLDNKRKIRELDFTHRKEVFNRYLSSYEELIRNLYELKSKIAKQSSSMSTNYKIQMDEVLELYISMKTLYQYSKTYLETSSKSDNTSIHETVKKFLENDLYTLIVLLDKENKGRALSNQLEEVNKNIECVLLSLSEITKGYIGSTKYE